MKKGLKRAMNMIVHVLRKTVLDPIILTRWWNYIWRPLFTGDGLVMHENKLTPGKELLYVDRPGKGAGGDEEEATGGRGVGARKGEIF